MDRHSSEENKILCHIIRKTDWVCESPCKRRRCILDVATEPPHKGIDCGGWIDLC